MTEFDTLKGLRHSEQLVVEHKDTAAVYGSGALVLLFLRKPATA